MRNFEAFRCSLLALLDDAVTGVRHHHRAHAHRAARMRAAADGREVGVAGDQLDLRQLDREPFGDELREAGLVALACGERA